MQLTHIFVGIDLGDKNSVARLAVDRGPSERFGFTNNRRGRALLLEEVKRRAVRAGAERIQMAYEASSAGFILRDEAEAAGIGCAVLAPTKMEKSVEQRRQKNDDRDAEDVLEKLRAHVLAGNRLPTVWIPEVETRDDRELVRRRQELGERQTEVKTQVQMLLKRYGVEKPDGVGKGWTAPYRRWLAELTQKGSLGSSARQVLESLLRQLHFIEEELKYVDKLVEQLAAQPQHRRIVEELRKEKGVGLLTAMAYRTELGNAGRFRRGRQVGKFVGLTPTCHESGQQNDRKGHISRQGSPRLRRILCQSSWVHIAHDPEAARVYRQLVLRNPKRKKIAVVAVMRRLAVKLWHRMRRIELEAAAA